MNKEKFKRIVDEGIERERNFMIVKIVTEGSPAPEIIINPSENFTDKVRYYLNNYTDDMELINAKKAGRSVRIVDVLMTRNLNDLAWFVY